MLLLQEIVDVDQQDIEEGIRDTGLTFGFGKTKNEINLHRLDVMQIDLSVHLLQ